MNNAIKYVLAALIGSTSVATLPMNFEVAFDGQDVKINGQNINGGINFSEFAFPLIGVGLAYYFCAKQSKGIQDMIVMSAGMHAGKMVSDIVNKKITTKKIVKNIAPLAGNVIGNVLHEKYGKNNKYVPDGSFSAYLGSALISAIYGNANERNIYLGKAFGSQIGTHLYPSYNTKDIGNLLGTNIGAALATNEPAIQNFYFKKAALQTMAVGALQDMLLYRSVPINIPIIFVSDNIFGKHPKTES